MRGDAVWIGIGLLLCGLVTAVIGWAAEGRFAVPQVTSMTATASLPFTVSSDDTLAIVVCTIEWDERDMAFDGVRLSPGLDPPWTIRAVNDNEHVTCPAEWPMHKVTVVASCDDLYGGLVGARELLLFDFRDTQCGIHWLTMPATCPTPGAAWPNTASTVGGIPLLPGPPYWNLSLAGGSVSYDCGTVGVAPENWTAAKQLYR